MSRVIFASLLVFLPCFTACDDPVSPHVVEAQRVRRQLAKWANETYGVRVATSGGAMMHEVSEISIGFAHQGEGTVELGRCMLVPIIEKFLRMINEDEVLRPYLSHHPFTSLDIEVTIGFTNQDGRILRGPSLSFAFLSKGKVYYEQMGGPKDLLENIHTETFEDAQKIVHEGGCEGPQ